MNEYSLEIQIPSEDLALDEMITSSLDLLFLPLAL